MNGMLRTLAVAGTLLAGLVLPASAQAYYAVTEGAVNMRTGPGVTYPRIATVPAGVQVWVTDCAPRWCSITWRNKSGWVASSLLSGGQSATPVYPNDYYDDYGDYYDDYCDDYSYPDCWPGGGGGYYDRHHHHRHHHHHDGDHKPPKGWTPGKPWHPDHENGPNNNHPNFQNGPNNNHPNFPRSFNRPNSGPLFNAPSNGPSGGQPRFFDRGGSGGPGPDRSGPPGGRGDGGGGGGGGGGDHDDWNRGR